MTVYQKTMREALEEMEGNLIDGLLEGINLEAAMSGAQISKLKKAFEPMRGKKIGMASGQKLSSIIDKVDDDKQALSQLVKADIPFVSQLAVTRLITKHGMKGAEIRKMQEEVELDEEFKKGDKVTVKVAKSSDREIQQLSKKFGDTVSGVVMGQSGKILMVKTNKGQINPPVKDVMKEELELDEEVALDEAKYELYHKDFSSAMQHAYKMAKKLHGITISPDEISDKVATGPRKPSEGKTNKYRLEGDKGGIQIQVYNKGGSKPFELNMYKEEVDLDEGRQMKDPKKEMMVSKDGKVQVINKKDWPKYEKKGYVQAESVDEMEMTFGTKRIPAAMKKKGMDKVKTKGLNKDKASAAYIGKKKTYEEANPFDLRRLLDEKLDQDDKPTVNNVVKMLNKASKAHAGQAKDLEKAVSEADDFKPHMMYDPKTGKGYKADTMDDHLRMKKMGYTHDAPQKEEVELDENEGLKNKSEKSGISVGILKKVYNRGLAAYKTGHRPGTTAPQWAMARVNSFITKGSGTWGGADKDLAKQTEAVDPADIDTSATDDDIKSADKNIMMQMRKAVSLRGQYPVEFLDKKKVKIPQKMAQAVIDKYNKQKKPMDKEKFQAKIAKSYKSLMMVVKEQKEETLLDRMNRKILENNNG